MPPMATDSGKKSGYCDSSSSIVKHDSSNENGSANLAQTKSSSSSKKGNIKSCQLSRTDCKKPISCDSRKDKAVLKRLNSGTYVRFSGAWPENNLRTQNFNSPLSKGNSSKCDRGFKRKCHKMNSCEKVIYSVERKKFVEDLVWHFEKASMNDKKNEVKKVSTNAKFTKPKHDRIGIPCSAVQAPPSDLCRMKLGTVKPSQCNQFPSTSETSSASLIGRRKESNNNLGFLLPSTCKKQNCKCPADSNQSRVPLFKAALFYDDYSDAASSRVVILASCVNEYIKTVFQQLDHQNRGSISVEEFECLCRVLGISSRLSQTNKRASWVTPDGRIDLSGFEKLMWKCMTNENQKLPVSLEERRSSTILAHSVLNASRRLQSLESITDDLRGISKSMASNDKLTSAASDEALPKCDGSQLFERNDSNLESLKEFSELSIVCYEENKRMKSIIEDLRKALQASDAENLALKVKMELLAEAQGNGEENIFKSPQKKEAGGKSDSKSDYLPAKEKDSTYSSGRNKQSTPLWKRKSQFLDELLSYHELKFQKDTEHGTSPLKNNRPLSDDENHLSVSANNTASSEEDYLCMDVIPGRLHISKPLEAPVEAEAIYSSLGENPFCDNIFQFTPKPSRRRSKTLGISYSPNRERLYRSRLSRKFSRIYENFQPPTPPSVDSIPKRTGATFSTSPANETRFQRQAEQKGDCKSTIKGSVGFETYGILHGNENKSQEVVRKNLLSMNVDGDKVQLKNESEIDSNTREENVIPCTIATFSNNCSLTEPSNAVSTSVTCLPYEFSRLRPSSSADELDHKVISSHVLDSRPVSQPAELLQSFKSPTLVTNSAKAPASSDLTSKSAVKECTKQKLGTSVPKLLTNFNSGWHTTLRHPASCLQDVVTPQPPASNMKLRSQPLPQLLATKAMLEATLNAVLLNNRLIADHGVRSLTPETLRRRPGADHMDISFLGKDSDQSSNSTCSSITSEGENGSLLQHKNVSEFGRRDQLKQLHASKTEDTVKNNEMKNFSSLCLENFAEKNAKENVPVVNKAVKSSMTKKGEKPALRSIPEFAEKTFDTNARTHPFSNFDEKSGQTEKNSPIPSSVDELMAELVDYCKERGVDISSKSLDTEPSSNYGVGSAVENSKVLQLYTLDEAAESHGDVRESKDMAVIKARFELVQESSAQASKSVPSEEIYISSSGSDDSGRGDSEGSCSSPEDLSGGSDDGLWTPEDDSPSSDVVHGSDQRSLACYFHRSKFSADAVKVSNGHEEEKPQMNHEALHRNASSLQPLYPCHGCGRAFCKCGYTSENVPSVQCPSSFSYDRKAKVCKDPKEIHESTSVTKPSNHGLENGSLFKEVYDNIDSTSPLSWRHSGVQDNGFFANKEPAISLDSEIQIIDLDEEPEFVVPGQKNDEKLTSEKNCQKPKGFLGRRCRSFNTFRSFLSHTASQLKRNSIGRSSFSLPRPSSKTYDDFSTGITEKELPKSIVKRPLSDYADQKKKKRISFKDTVDVFPIKCQGIESKIGENKPLISEKYLYDESKNFSFESRNVDNLHISPKKDIDVSLVTNIEFNCSLLEHNRLNSVKTLIPVNRNNVTLISESNDCADYISDLSLPSTKPVTSHHDGSLRREGAPNFEEANVSSLMPSSDVEVAKVECIPESRALLEALEDDLEVILKALIEDESKIQ